MNRELTYNKWVKYIHDYQLNKYKVKKFKVKVNYWSNVSHLKTEEEIKKTEIWEDTKEEIFKKFDKQNNKLRYCNGSYWKFEFELHNFEYNKWYNSLDKSTQLDMYYGNGVVD